MPAVGITLGKTVNEGLKAGCRCAVAPILSILPDLLVNRLPFLGHIRIPGPGGWKLRMHTHGPHGKDRIAIKLAKRGLAGYEGETTRLFLPLVRQAHTVLDIGANTGLFALLAARSNPGCAVWAFEPVPFICDMLQRNISLNRLANVHPVAAAVSDVAGETSFFVTNTHVGIPTDSSACAGFRQDVEQVRVPTITLDDFVARERLPRVDVVKIDAEAMESQVIRGAARMLAAHRPIVICEVLEDVDHGELQHLFDALGYRFFHIGPGAVQERPRLKGSLAVDARNYAFVPTQKHSMLEQACREAGTPLVGASLAASGRVDSR